MPYPQPTASPGAAPAFDVVTVRGYTDRSGEERAAYTRIGAAWRRDRGGFKLRLDALPINDTIFLFERRDDAKVDAPKT
jgi:hypothetical protein